MCHECLEVRESVRAQARTLGEVEAVNTKK